MHLDKVWFEADTHFNYGTTSEHIYDDKVPQSFYRIVAMLT